MTDYRIWPATNGPNVSFNDGNPINVGTEFYVTATAWATHLHFYRGDANITSAVGYLWRVDGLTTGTQLASKAFTLSGFAQWVTVALDTPIQLVANQRYRTVMASPGYYTATGGYWNTGPGSSGPVTNGILVCPDDDSTPDGDQGSFSYGAAGTFPTTGFNGGNYWTDVTVTDVNPAAAPSSQILAESGIAITLENGLMLRTEGA